MQYGCESPKDRYPTFLRLIHMWRHLKLLKRLGRGHDPAGIGATEMGSCAVLCPACPHPGKNLPDDWQGAPPSQCLFVGIDANFRLKRKKVSSDSVDPGLNHRYAYFVETKGTCNNHDALKLAHMKGSHGTAASGVGCVECTRHDMKRPCSVSDLQKGERYINMDYLFFSSMGHHSSDMVVISYNIACQWSRYIWDRLLQYEHTFDWQHGAVTFLIPKFHLPAHQSSCQTAYFFNLTVNIGHMDGEAVECGWATINPFASSTKEMGPSAHRDLLDDIFVAVEEWEKDRKNTNPFVVTHPGITLATTRLRLAEEEAAAIASGQSIAIHEKASASYMVSAGIDLEEQQRHLRIDTAALGQHSTDLQCAKIMERCNGLQCQIDAWMEIQQLYMPGIVARRSQASASPSEPAVPILTKGFHLLLPSSVISLPMNVLMTYDATFASEPTCIPIRIASSMASGRNTRARNTIATIEVKVSADAQHYRTAYEALDSLASPLSKMGWKVTLCQLRSEDIKGFEVDPLISRDRIQLSWIWRTPCMEHSGAVRAVDEDRGADESEDTEEALHIEWCKSRARAARWWEECCLLLEEMRCIIAFHEWHASWWEDQAQCRNVDGVLTEGLFAYAHRQADILREMCEHCRTSWASVRNYALAADAALDDLNRFGDHDSEHTLV
ncbi:hypothetical protein A0H81_05915 [Grifola frondosa]|uniref:CxC2-like cysteine cluster KDZ transposase-associated domain-containing protein n=1 Tax=Grifola frondosa TaxID=5627 RepID=A0A1C7MFT5_GRIFR|nr:hypothetical protein A0H81_05915 [Grifola frondosa]